ncbi:RNA-binding protein 41-like isoform X2 [Hetaerina americana]|uniref:RNA-binding protein 41-like isoform X2 n=1 Tax=Hetaerina americana TaxID=62018 RepID=UPI003A7F2457
MAHIHFSRGKSYELAINGDENPTEYLESEGERLIKEMVQKQLNKQVSLKEQLQEGKVFETCAEFVPLTKLTSGQISFTNFKELAEKVSHVEDLKSKGLTEKEIDFLNDYEKGESYFEEKYKKVELSALKTNLEEIQKKIEKRSKGVPDEKSSGGKDSGVSRHELELSLCVKPQSEHTKLLQFALSCQQSSSTAVDSRPLNHPINSLKEIESELFGHLKPPLPKRRKKRPRDHWEGVGQVSIVGSDEASPSSSLWDKRSAPQRVKRPAKRADGESRVYECATKRVFTIRDGEIVPLDGRTREVMGKGCASPSDSSTEGHPFVFADACGESSTSSLQLVPLEMIQNNKMTEEEMSENPHFNKSYSRGEPSQVLYIKNISPAVKEDDLVRLFGHFETPGENKIAYRLMTGRMKGQAFITFPTIEKASQALEAINGYYCKGKPLVLQFGKSKK